MFHVGVVLADCYCSRRCEGRGCAKAQKYSVSTEHYRLQPKNQSQGDGEGGERLVTAAFNSDGKEFGSFFIKVPALCWY